MYEPARRLLYALAAVAASMCVSAVPVLASAQDTTESDLPATTTDLRVPSSEPRYAAIVIDATSGDILYQKRADSPRYPASITKIMTLYLAFEALSTGKLHESDLVTVSPLAASQPPTKLGLRPGDTITVSDAMHAMAVHSANDMAMALAEKIGGTESRFAAMMTLKAHELGMNNSHFVNPNGLPDSRHISSAHDIAILCEAVLRDYPQYYHYFGDDEFTYRGVTYRNTNHLLGQMPGVDGFKTGFTNAAGYNLAASAVRGGHRLIAVVLGGSSSPARNANVQDLLLTGFDIETRRDNGEHIMLTQALFEQPPAQGPTLPQTSQGDVSDPIDLVLKDSAQGKPVAFGSGAVTQLSSSSRSLLAEVPTGGIIASKPVSSMPSAQAAADPKTWHVQVGAFHSSKLATHQVDVIADGFKAIFDDREGEVDHVGGQYEAVFTGFTQSEAADACAKVQAGGQPCVTIHH